MPDLRRGSLIWLWLSVVVIALDQVTKWIAVDALLLYQQVPGLLVCDFHNNLARSRPDGAAPAYA